MSKKLLARLPPCAPSTSHSLHFMPQSDVLSDICTLATIEAKKPKLGLSQTLSRLVGW